MVLDKNVTLITSLSVVELLRLPRGSAGSLPVELPIESGWIKPQNYADLGYLPDPRQSRARRPHSHHPLMSRAKLDVKANLSLWHDSSDVASKNLRAAKLEACRSPVFHCSNCSVASLVFFVVGGPEVP